MTGWDSPINLILKQFLSFGKRQWETERAKFQNCWISSLLVLLKTLTRKKQVRLQSKHAAKLFKQVLLLFLWWTQHTCGTQISKSVLRFWSPPPPPPPPLKHTSKMQKERIGVLGLITPTLTLRTVNLFGRTRVVEGQFQIKALVPYPPNKRRTDLVALLVLSRSSSVTYIVSCWGEGFK